MIAAGKLSDSIIDDGERVDSEPAPFQSIQRQYPHPLPSPSSPSSSSATHRSH